MTILDFDDCIEECLKLTILTKDEADALIRYMKEGLEGRYWDIFLNDIEEENGMSSENAKAFKQFYDKYKKYEQEEDEFKWIAFDCTVWQ